MANLGTGGFALAQAFVRIRPDATGFRPELEAKLKAALLGLRPNVKVTADVKDVQRKTDDVAKLLTRLTTRVFEAKMVLRDAGSQAKLARFSEGLVRLSKMIADPKADLDIVRAEAKLLGYEAELNTLSKKVFTTHIMADMKDPLQRLALLRTQLTALTQRVIEIPIDVTTKKGAAELARLQAKMAAVTQSMEELNRVAAGRDPISGKFISAAKAAELLAPALFNVEREMGKVGKAVTEAEPKVEKLRRRFFSLFSGLVYGEVKLFGGLFGSTGILGKIRVWHLIADSLLEIVAILIPAAVAATAFGVAAAQAAIKVYHHFVNLHTVFQATGKAIPPLTQNFHELQQAVQPHVYQLLGDALTIVGQKQGVFGRVAMETAHNVDILAARLTVAVTSGEGTGRIMAEASEAFRVFANVLANLGSIIGSVLKALPGFALALFKIVETITHFGAAVAQAAEPLLKLALAAHGLILWTGIAVTIVTALSKKFYTFAASLAMGVVKLTFLAEAFSNARKEAGFLAGAMALVNKISLKGWIGIAAVALTGLIVLLANTKDSAQKLSNSLQEMIKNADVSDLLATITKAQTTTATQLAAAYVRLNATQKTLTQGTQLNTARVRYNDLALSSARRTVDEHSSSLKGLVGQYNLVSGRVNALARAYGGQRAALGLLNAAGVTSTQLLEKGEPAWLVLAQQVRAVVAGYEAMGQRGSALANDLQVLDQQIDPQVVAMQKLNQAWDQFIGTVTGSQTAFDTFALGMVTLRQNMNKAAAGANTTTHRLGELKVKTDVTGAAMDGLSQSSLALNQAFAQQIVNANAVIDTLRTAGTNTKTFKRAVSDILQPMIRFARGSDEATAQLVALAQEAGYQGPVSLQRLIKWMDHTHNSTADLKKIINEATVRTALLTAAMTAQGNFMANKLISDINKAILAYSGVEKAATAYGRAIAETGRQSERTKAARQNLISQIIKTGTVAGESKTSIAGMIAKILNIPLKRALEIVMRGIGRFHISEAARQHLRNEGPPNPAGAQGLFINQGTTPTADDVMVRASKGELIVPTKMVNAGEVDHLRGRIPGFAQGGQVGSYAAGGLVKQGNMGVLTGAAAVEFNNRQVHRMIGSMESQMNATWRMMLAAARAAMRSNILTGGPPVGPIQNYARRLLNRYGWGGQWGAFNALEMSEAGWNPNAQNPTSTAYGLGQFLDSTWAGFGPKTSNPYRQLDYMMAYIRQRYGSPAAAWAFHQAHNWYGEGTDSASPGWAVVGEKGPELVRMKGGEQVIPGFAKGGLVDQIHHAERIIRHHPEGSRRWSNLTDKLSAVNDRIHDNRQLARFLRGDALRDVKENIRDDERIRRRLLDELKPVRHQRHVVRRVASLLHSQERGLAAAIQLAQHRHMSGSVRRMERLLRRDKNLRGWFEWWLDKRWWTPTRAQRRRDDRHADAIIRDAIRAAGLPIVSFDKGGVLPPGATLAVNTTGRPERVSSGGDQKIVIQFRASAGDAHGQYLLKEIQKLVRTRGGGDVQVAFGQAY